MDRREIQKLEYSPRMNKEIIMVTPLLTLRDGVCTHSRNMVYGLNKAGVGVHVFTPTVRGFLYQGLKTESNELASEDFERYTIDELSPDLPIYVQYALGSYWFANFRIHRLLKKYATKRKLILGFHEAKRDLQILRSLGNFIYSRALQRADRVIVFAQSSSLALSKLTKKRIENFPLGVPEVYPVVEVGEQAPTFVMFGYYLKDKGFEIGLEAFNSLCEKSSKEIRLIIICSLRQRVGSARIKSRSEERAYSTFISKVESSKFRGKIELHGFVSAEDLKMLVQKSNYIWMPYLNSTQSIVAVSAKQFGTPVISTSLPTLMESFGNSGIYIDSVEPEDWSSALQRLIEIPDFTSERNLRAKLLRDLSSGQSMEQIALKIIG